MWHKLQPFGRGLLSLPLKNEILRNMNKQITIPPFLGYDAYNNVAPCVTNFNRWSSTAGHLDITQSKDADVGWLAAS